MMRALTSACLSFALTVITAQYAAAETWSGGVILNRVYRPVTLDLSDPGQPPTAVVTYAMSRFGLGDLSLVSLERDGAALKVILAEADGDRHQFDGVVQSGAYRGRYRGPAGEGAFDFLEIEPQEGLEAWAGGYTSADGGYSLFYANRSLVLVDFQSGTIRALYPRGQGRFVFGPGLRVAAPVQGEVILSGETMTVTRDGRTIEARRIASRVLPVTFRNGDVELAGEVLLPSGQGPFPGVVFGHGGGQSTRGGGHVADYFLNRGYAVLRFDKRGSGESTGEWRASFSDYADDVLAAVAVLRGMEGIRADRVGLWGPSQAGWIMPIAAARDTSVAFVMLQGAPGVTLLDQEMYFGRTSWRAAGLEETDIEAMTRFRELKYLALLDGDGMARFEAALPEARTQLWFDAVGPGLPNEAFWKPNLLSDPLEAWRGVRAPGLILIGSADDTVPPEASARRLAAFFVDQGRTDVDVVVLPGAEHEMMLSAPQGPAARTGFAPAYFEAMDAFLDRIGMQSSAAN